MRRTVSRTVGQDGREVARHVETEIMVHRRYKGPWMELNQFSGEGLSELAERLADRTLGMQAVRVLIACVKSADRKNVVHAGRKDLARILEMPESNVAKALKDLTETGFLEAPKLRFAPYTISPRFFWKASAADLREELARRQMLDGSGMMKSRAA